MDIKRFMNIEFKYEALTKEKRGNWIQKRYMCMISAYQIDWLLKGQLRNIFSMILNCHKGNTRWRKIWKILWECLVQRNSANILKKARSWIIPIKIGGEKARKFNQEQSTGSQDPENQLQDNLIRISLMVHVQKCL